MSIVLNSTFRTARERSRLCCRFTHRLSTLERQRRVAFVRENIKSFLRTSGFFTEPMLQSQLDGNDGVTFKRGKVRVEGVKAVLIPTLNTPALKYWYRLFHIYWAIMVSLNQLNKALTLIRRMFGSNVFDAGKYKFTWWFYRIFAAGIYFRKSWYQLNTKKRNFSMYLSKIKGLHKWRHHPVSFQFKQDLKRIMDWKAKWQREVIDDRLNTIEHFEKFISDFPRVNPSIYGGIPLTTVQLRRLANRKYNVMFLTLWDLLFNARAIKKEFVINNKVSFTVVLSLKALSIYTKTYVIGVGIKPRRFVPYIAKDNTGFENQRISKFVDPGQMIVPFTNVWMFTDCMSKRLKRQHAWLDTTLINSDPKSLSSHMWRFCEKGL